jgi:hypothetical protein
MTQSLLSVPSAVAAIVFQPPPASPVPYRYSRRHDCPQHGGPAGRRITGQDPDLRAEENGRLSGSWRNAGVFA